MLVSGAKADPLMFLLLHVGGDVSGLFRSDPLDNVGYAAHIGGMFGGVLFFALDHFFETVMASKLSRYGRVLRRHRRRIRKKSTLHQ